MKQVSLRLRDGNVDVLSVPVPGPNADTVLVDVRASVLSVGTERSKLQAGREGLIGKAKARPDQARQVIEKARRDGLRQTVGAVRARLDQPTALGYSAAGVVLQVGARVRGIAPGDRVACGGGEHAVHAEIVSVPGNLCARIPDGVDFEAAAFATIASVAMHGVRQSDVRLGERVAVIGLGLVGQLTGQILRAAGCQVVGIDTAAPLVSKALSIASADVAYARRQLDSARLPDDVANCDAVIVTAATRSNDPITLASRLLRDRGRVVIVGDVSVDVPRAPYYERELELRFSRSYGPGRYDREYEERGLDYPIGYVRWTEQRNMAAYLELVGAGRVNVGGLILERVPIDRAPEVYERLVASDDSPLGVVLQYEPNELSVPTVPVAPAPRTAGRSAAPSVNVIGAGSFSQRILIPSLRDAGFTLGSVASAKGLSAHAVKERFSFSRASTAEEAVLDPAASLVAVATRHSSHATLAEAALAAGKALFIEKPPCLTATELQSLRAARARSGAHLAVGFNRRHAPLAVAFRDHLRQAGGPIEVLYRVAAGPLPADHWLNDPAEGGGRLVGEGCHFIDFACWIAGSSARSVRCVTRADGNRPSAAAQGFTVVIEFASGSVATVIYTDLGASGLAKEYVEGHAASRSAVIDDFRRLKLVDGNKVKSTRKPQDKGHRAQFDHLRSVLAGEVGGDVDPDPLESMSVVFAALDDALGRQGPRAPGC